MTRHSSDFYNVVIAPGGHVFNDWQLLAPMTHIYDRHDAVSRCENAEEIAPYPGHTRKFRLLRHGTD